MSQLSQPAILIVDDNAEIRDLFCKGWATKRFSPPMT